jgi:predicted O-methyltransferase YrrM
VTFTREAYESAFTEESRRVYPAVDALERATGFALEPERLLSAAKVLACPVKKNPPNWQHGRVLYAVTRRYLADRTDSGPVRTLDIGTAKGFSALCVRFACEDAGVEAQSVSLDVIPPEAVIRRNTVAEVDGLKTLPEILQPWLEAERITFEESTGIEWLLKHSQRVHVAFVDGKHSGDVVYREGLLLSARQESGDVVVFDDVHIPDVSQAVDSLAGLYDIERLQILSNRAYAIARRK